MSNTAVKAMTEKNIKSVAARQNVVKIAVLAITYLFLFVMALIVLFPF